MKNSLFEQVRKFEDYIAEQVEDSDRVDELITISSAYACAYIPFFEEVKTDASDSMMLLKIYLSTLKKLERAIVEAGIRKMVKFTFSDDGSEILVEEWRNAE